MFELMDGGLIIPQPRSHDDCFDSFATLPPAQIIFDTLYADGTCPSSVVNGVTVKGACPEAYGMLIGTMALCSLTSIGLSFLPSRQLKKIFPPVVTGTVICLIGISLIGSSGVLNWGGGALAVSQNAKC